MVSGGDNWATGATSRAKLQSNHHRHPVFFYRLDALPVAQPTESKKDKKVKVHTLDIVPLRSETPLQKRSGMVRVLKGSRSFTCIPTRSSAVVMSHTCLKVLKGILQLFALHNPANKRMPVRLYHQPALNSSIFRHISQSTNSLSTTAESVTLAKKSL